MWDTDRYINFRQEYQSERTMRCKLISTHGKRVQTIQKSKQQESTYERETRCNRSLIFSSTFIRLIFLYNYECKSAMRFLVYLLVIGWASRVEMVWSDDGRSVQNFCILSLPSTPFPFHIRVAVSMYSLEINWNHAHIYIYSRHTMFVTYRQDDMFDSGLSVTYVSPLVQSFVIQFCEFLRGSTGLVDFSF